MKYKKPKDINQFTFIIQAQKIDGTHLKPYYFNDYAMGDMFFSEYKTELEKNSNIANLSMSSEHSVSTAIPLLRYVQWATVID